MPESTPIPCGPFELREPVGSGAMGTVWRARDTRRETDVAVKVISREPEDGAEVRRRFRREVQAHARLRHPGIATVYDYGVVSAEAAGRADGKLPADAPYLAVEYAESGTLADGGEPEDWSELRSLLVQVLDALAYAHARDIIHRDLKPGNVLLFGEEGARSYKLADFGVAYSVARSRLAGADTDRSVVGTPEYMAPEQFRGDWRNFGPWTDFYAVGCLAYRLVCRRYPFSGETVREMAAAHLEQELPPLDPVFAVPRGFIDWIRKMTVKAHDLRFRRAADAARALADLPVVDASEEGANLGDETSSVRLEDATPSGERPPDGLVEPSEPEPGAPRESEKLIPPTQLVSERQADVEGDSRRAERRREEETVTVEGVPAADGPLGVRASVQVGEAEPYFPERWQVQDSRHAKKEEIDTGWGLYGLREIPFVDRREERDAIWAAFQRVVEGNGPEAVVVEGRSGRGKSRLAEWMLRRVHEVGSFHTVRGSWGKKGSHRQGLAGMLDRMFAVWGLDRDAIYTRVRKRIRRWYPEERKGAYLDREARAITEIVEPSGGRSGSGRRYVFDSDRERFAVVRRVLAARARERPVAVWLDDAQWGPRALGFVEHLLEAESTERIAPLLTVRTEVLEQRQLLRDRVDAITARDTVTGLELDPLEDDDHAELLRRLLPLDDALVSEIAHRTAGNPLFAVQLVGDLVDRGFLEEGNDQLESRGPLEGVLPGHLSDLWRRRVERASESVGGPNPHEVVEIAAALGEHVSNREWRRACQRADRPIPEGLVDELVARGLAHREPGGWRFAHGMLVDALEARARDEGRLREHHRICARVIEDLYSDERPASVGRVAEHLVEAGAWEEAVDPLLRAARLSRRVGEYRRCRRLIEKRVEVLDRLSVDEDHRERVANRVVEARVHVVHGDEDRAERLAEDALAIADANDWTGLAGEALECLAAHRKVMGELGAAMELAERAQEEFEQVGDAAGWADAAMTRAHGLQCRSEHARARELLEHARRRFRESEEIQGALRAGVHINYSLIYEDRFEDARRRAGDLLDRASEVGNLHVEAHGWNQLGEIARFEGRWRRAQELYERSEEVWGRLGSNNRYLVRMNRAFVDLGTGDYERAAETVGELAERAESGGWGRMLPTLRLAGLVCEAGRVDEIEWGERFEEVREALREAENLERDHAWLAERLVEQLADQERTGTARRAEDLAEAIRSARQRARRGGDARRAEETSP